MGFRDYLVKKLGGYTKPPYVMNGGAKIAPGSPRKQTIGPDITSGSWVVWDGRIGIAHPGPDGLIEVHLVDKHDGSTTLITHQRPELVRRAKISEIPEIRRQKKSNQDLMNLGYKD